MVFWQYNLETDNRQRAKFAKAHIARTKTDHRFPHGQAVGKIKLSTQCSGHCNGWGFPQLSCSPILY